MALRPDQQAVIDEFFTLVKVTIPADKAAEATKLTERNAAQSAATSSLSALGAAIMAAATSSHTSVVAAAETDAANQLTLRTKEGELIALSAKVRENAERQAALVDQWKRIA